MWQAFEKAKLRKGQKIFIQAGSGGVGTIAIQLAKYLGTIVATTASTANMDWVKGLGADIVIDYKTQDFEYILKNYDLVLNSQDAKTLEKSLKTVKPKGKIISISGPPTPEFAKNIGASLIRFILSLISSGIRRKAKRKEIDYSFLFMQADVHQLNQITNLIESGVIKPIVNKIFPFEQTNVALDYVENGRAKGKVIVRVK